jgi:hypothetical protein
MERLTPTRNRNPTWGLRLRLPCKPALKKCCTSPHALDLDRALALTPRNFKSLWLGLRLRVGVGVGPWSIRGSWAPVRAKNAFTLPWQAEACVPISEKSMAVRRGLTQIGKTGVKCLDKRRGAANLPMNLPRTLCRIHCRFGVQGVNARQNAGEVSLWVSAHMCNAAKEMARPSFWTSTPEVVVPFHFLAVSSQHSLSHENRSRLPQRSYRTNLAQ